MEHTDLIEEAKKCLDAYGSACRGYWRDLDGRNIRSAMSEIKQVLDGNMTYEEFCDYNSIHPEKQCWMEFA